MTWGFKGFLKRLLEIPDFGGDAELAPPGRARLRYNNAGLALEASINAGPYLPIGGGSSSSSFQAVGDIAALSALDDSLLNDGDTVDVATLRDQFYLDTSSTRAIDGITVVATTSGSGRWIRRELPSTDWTTQDTWYIDPAGGDDENDGNTSGTALETWDELRRRFGKIPVRTFITVNLLGNPGNIVADFNTQQEGSFITSGIIVQGVTTVAATLPISAVTPHNNLTRTFGTLNMGANVSTHVNRLMRVTSGAATGAVAFALASGLGGVNTLDTGPFFDPGTLNEVYPAGGDTIEFCDQTTLSSIVVKPGAWVSVANCTITGRCTQEAGGTLSTNQCRINLAVTVRAPGYLSLFQATYVGVSGFIAAENANIAVFTVWSRGNIRLTNGSALNLSTSTIAFHSFANAGITLEGSSVLGTGALAYYRLSAVGSHCLRVREGSHVRLPAEFWGREVAIVAQLLVADIGPASMVTYQAGTPPDFTPNGALDVGGGGGNIAALPITTAANFSGFVVET